MLEQEGGAGFINGCWFWPHGAAGCPLAEAYADSRSWGQIGQVWKLQLLPLLVQWKLPTQLNPGWAALLRLARMLPEPSQGNNH